MHNSSPSSHHKRRKRILEAVELIEEILKEYELEIVNDKEWFIPRWRKKI